MNNFLIKSPSVLGIGGTSTRDCAPAQVVDRSTSFGDLKNGAPGNNGHHSGCDLRLPTDPSP